MKGGGFWGISFRLVGIDFSLSQSNQEGFKNPGPTTTSLLRTACQPAQVCRKEKKEVSKISIPCKITVVLSVACLFHHGSSFLLCLDSRPQPRIQFDIKINGPTPSQTNKKQQLNLLRPRPRRFTAGIRPKQAKNLNRPGFPGFSRLMRPFG